MNIIKLSGTVFLLLCVLSCSDMFPVHARRAAQQLCQASDIHQYLLENTKLTQQHLEKFCDSVGWPLSLNQ